jgi:anti-sigma regulatory factor (Ser/Thr protein kinase)
MVLDDDRAIESRVETNVASSDDASGEVREWLANSAHSPDLIADIEQAARELVDNAFRHATPPVVVELSSDPHRLRVAVSDGSTSAPLMGEPAGTGGFGLLLVDATSDAWGFDLTAQGKLVWVEWRS